MAVAQIPNMPAMPDIQSGYAKIGEQIAGVGKQIGGAIVDFASAQGKKKLIDEIKVKYPTVVQAYPEDVLMQMDNKELGMRLAAVVGIENAIPKLKEVDPKFSTADIEQMKAEIFKQPDQARTIARDWMAIAEKNRQDSVNKESLAMVGGQPAQPAMPQATPQTPSTISEADLTRETNDLLNTSKPVINNTMPAENTSSLGQQLAAVDAERTPTMPSVSQRPRTREGIYGDISASGKIPDKATQEIIDKASRSEKDINAEDIKRDTLKQKQEAAAAAILRRAKEHQDRMTLGNRNAKATEDLVALTAIQKVTDISKDQIDAEVKAGEAEQTAAALEPGVLRDAYVKSAIELRQKAGIMSPNLTVAQGVASGIVKTAETRNPKIAEAVGNQKRSREQEEAIRAYDLEVKGTSKPKYSEIDPKQQSEALKKIVELYRKSKKK